MGIWKPKLPQEFISDYFSGMTSYELAQKHNGSPDQAKRYLQYLRNTESLPRREDITEQEAEDYIFKGEGERREFREFLARARTEEEIYSKFGDNTLSLLKYDYVDYCLFEQLNDYGEKIFILLPKLQEDIKPTERDWSYHTSFLDDGVTPQAYQLIKMPDYYFDNDDECLDIIPFYDIHYGHYGHKNEKFLKYIRYIKETENVFTFLGGDIMENALDDGRGMTYDESKPPKTQLREIYELLAPIAHKILFCIPGNHEWRTFKRAGIDPMAVLAKWLDVPYFDGPVYCSITGAGYKWKIYAFHGNSSANTKGGKMNSAGRPRRFTDFINFYVSGHCHDPVINSETCICEDPINARLAYRTQWVVICPSFLRFEGTYAYRAGYEPPGKGGVKLRLYKNGDYEAILRDRT